MICWSSAVVPLKGERPADVRPVRVADHLKPGAVRVGERFVAAFQFGKEHDEGQVRRNPLEQVGSVFLLIAGQVDRHPPVRGLPLKVLLGGDDHRGPVPIDADDLGREDVIRIVHELLQREVTLDEPFRGRRTQHAQRQAQA
jgi:hypothetical protein